MPYMVVTTSFPGHKVTELVKKYAEVEAKLPWAGNGIGTFLAGPASTRDQEGVKTLAICQPNEGKLEEALTFEYKRLNMLNDIEGFEFKLTVYFSAEEGRAIRSP